MIKRLRPQLIAVAISSVLASGCAFLPETNHTAAQSQVLPEVNIPYQTFTLDNGLTVIVNEDRKAPVVATNIWYKVGSKDESIGSRGFAHLFEHLMFQGSEHFQGEFFAPFQNAGVTDQNGTTSNDRTNYYQTVPTPALDMTLWLESDRMGHFLKSISQAKLDEQRDVVKNEKREGENVPYGKMWNRLAEQTFPPGHPYSWPVIGYMEDLDAASLDQVRGWFRKYYTPSNAVLVLSGDIDLATAKQKVEHFFGDIPAGEPLTKFDSWVAKRTEDKRDIMQDRVPQPQLMKVWNVAQLGTEDSEALSLAASILGNRLHERLALEEDLVTDASTFMYERLLAGQMMISASAKPDVSLASIEKIIDEELSDFISKGPTRDELDRARFSEAAYFIRNSEKVGGMGGKANTLARGEVLYNDPDYFKKQFAMMAALTPERIRDISKKWLDSGAYILEIQPFPEYSHASKGADRSKMPDVGDKVSLTLPAIQHATLDNGLKVVLASRHQTPLVEMELQFDAGLAAREGKPGLPSLTLSMLDQGTTSRSGTEIAVELERLGSQIDVDNSLDTSSITLSSLTASLKPSLEILADILQNPAFDEADLKRVRSNQLEQIRYEESSPMKVIRRVLPGLLYDQNHAYNTPWGSSGTKSTVEQLQREDLVNFWQTWLRPDNATLIVTGDITLDELVTTLNTAFADWQAPTSPLPEKAIGTQVSHNKGNIYLVDYPAAQQSVVVASQLIASSTSSDTLAFNMMNDVIGGEFTARVNMNLREDKGWAYGAYSYTIGARSERPYMVSASVQTDKTGPALAEIFREYSEFTGHHPATENELELVKQNRIRTEPGNYETNDDLLSAISTIVKYQFPETYLTTYTDRVAATSLDKVRDLANETLKPTEFVWVVAGDASVIRSQLEALKLGEVIEIDKEGNPVKALQP